MQNTKMSPQEFITVLHQLLSEKIPTEHLVDLGGAIATLNLNDWKTVAGNIFVKDIKPIYQSFKELKKDIKAKNPGNILKNLAMTSAETFRGSIKNATVSIPEAGHRVTAFSKKIMEDYNHLKSNEERGLYILKLSLYAGVFGMAFHRGSKHKMLSSSTAPLMALGATLVFINRLLEHAEVKLEGKSEAIKLTHDLRSVIRTLTMGFSSGMTFNVVIEGIVDQKILINDLSGKSIGSLMPKSIIDNMIYAALMGLFSSEKD